MKPIKRKGRSFVELKDGKRVTPIKDSKSRKGDIAEHYAIIWLWEQGYEVFINAGCSGAVDLIAWKGDNKILIDVKTFFKRKDRNAQTYSDISSSRTLEQKNLGVQILGFHPVTKDCYFIKHRE